MILASMSLAFLASAPGTCWPDRVVLISKLTTWNQAETGLAHYDGLSRLHVYVEYGSTAGDIKEEGRTDAIMTH